ncbi:MAG: hypothetical protein F4W90_06620 [Gammaproteobacteria bacterium]|nr:hypothetical protein [Gammaproteobacteria bacterium]
MPTHSEKNGRFRFDISYRRFQGDQGLSIRVEGPVANESRELLRFDCFEKTPHYHTEVYGRNVITPIDSADASEWSLATLQEQFVTLIEAAGADTMTDAEHENLTGALHVVCQKSRDLIAEEKRV